MPNFTEHYNLKKPLQEEFYNIDDHNGNMDIIDAVLKELSEDSGVVIGAEEPEKGEVWIDTDDESGDGGAVTSVNGKIGDVQLTAADLDAYTTGQTYNKTEANDLLKEKAPTNHTHTLEALGAAALKHFHDGADIVSGFETLRLNIGAAKIATGSYTGTGKYGLNNPNSLTFEFTPKMLFITIDTATNTLYTIAATLYLAGLSHSSYAGSYKSCGTISGSGNSNNRVLNAKLTGNTLYWYNPTTSTAADQMDDNRITYHWAAIG